MSGRSTIAYPGLVSYLPCQLLIPYFTSKPSPNSPVSSALKAEPWTVPSSPTSTLAPTSPVTAVTASSFDVGQTSAECPRPLHRLHSFSVQLAFLWPCLPHLYNSTPSLRHYLRRLWCCCQRQPRPSHRRPRCCLYRLIRPFPDVRLFRCRGLHLSRGRHWYHRRRSGCAQSSIHSCCFQKVGDVALAQP